jgi:hypothetical protein
MRIIIISFSCLLAAACAATPQKTVATVASSVGASQHSCDQLIKAQANVDKALKIYERARANFRSNLVVAYQAQQNGGGAWGNINSATNGADLTAGNISYQVSLLKGKQLEIGQAIDSQKCASEATPAAK